MLRFDVPPVWSNVARWEAFVSFVISGLALLYSPWLMIILLVQGLVRGFMGPQTCPAHRLWNYGFERLGWAGRKENAGAKMFANKVLALASTVALIAYAMGSSMWQVPVTALLIFTSLEWAFSFCAACWVYGAWYRWFPPKT
ncbi:DUF4395 family protein [Paenalcaligenes hominis]|uniref:DUF4395 family protein n=1 Tax=Paenalcaligenes hominis TaxID=643674 RepID=UPI003525A97E